jgi:hypothetical protein
MDMSTLNVWAVLVAAIAGHLIGALWYSPILFSNAWMDSIGKKEADFKKVNMGMLLTTTFIYMIIMAFCLAMFLYSPEIGMQEGAFYGFLTGFGWIFFVLATNSQFEQRPFKYTLISGAHWTVVFTVMGLILGAWK